MTTKERLPEPTNVRASHHIFISYSSKNRSDVFDIADAIEADGNVVWIDKSDLIGGEEWQIGLADALNRAILVVLAVSPDSMKSGWVMAEIQRARELGLTIIPVTVKPLDDAGKARWTALELDALHNRDLSDKNERERQLLLRDVKAYSKIIQLTNNILTTDNSVQHDAIVELLNLVEGGENYATKNICHLLQMDDSKIPTNMLRTLKSHPVAKKLPPAVVDVLKKLCTHPNVLITGWAKSLLRN